MSARQHIVAALGAALVVSLTVPTSAQDVASANLKAEYIQRFLEFTQWPAAAAPPAGTLTVCVVGDVATRDALQRIFRDVRVDGRPVAVAFGRPDKPPAPCHALWVSTVSSDQAARLVGALGAEPVLTMSDIEGFNGRGGIAEFFYDNAQKLRFSIDLEALKKSRLQLSSRLLSLSRPRR
jgi:hypothetical protein